MSEITEARYVIAFDGIDVVLLRAGLYLVQEWCTRPEVFAKSLEGIPEPLKTALQKTSEEVGPRVGRHQRDMFEGIMRTFLKQWPPDAIALHIEKARRLLQPSYEAIQDLAAAPPDPADG